VKLVTLDYGCGTSSSILDYGIKDVVIVSEDNYEHVFEVEDDLLFIGHDFLFFLWNTDEKISRWMSRKDKWEHWVWCFERIDSIVPVWMQKSHISLSIASKFCKRILACDEDDCDKYGFDWLPQWASRRFYDQASHPIKSTQLVFSGQTDKPEYQMRTELIEKIKSDSDISQDLKVTNRLRTLDWNGYVENLLDHSRVLNPVGVLKALNTRSYEAIYSGRLLFQQSVGRYSRHEKLLSDVENVFFFQDFDHFKKRVIISRNYEVKAGTLDGHDLYSRMRSLGVEIK